MDDVQYFRVSLDGDEDHRVGDETCDAGWCNGHQGSYDYPRRCQCGGLIHADFGDENSDGDYWLFERCDRCGDIYRFVEDLR